MPSSNGVVDGNGDDEEGVVGAKGINIVFSLHVVTILSLWIWNWNFHFLTNMHLFTIESHCVLLISHNHLPRQVAPLLLVDQVYQVEVHPQIQYPPCHLQKLHHADCMLQ